MEWYGKRADVRQSGLGCAQDESVMLDLLKDKPYIHSDAPRPAVEDPEPPIDNDSDDEDNDSAPPSVDNESEDENKDPPPLMEDDDFEDEPNDDSVLDEQLGAQSERGDYERGAIPSEASTLSSRSSTRTCRLTTMITKPALYPYITC